MLFERLTLKPKLAMHAHSLIYFYWHLVGRYSDLVIKLLLGLHSRSLSLNFLTPLSENPGSTPVYYSTQLAKCMLVHQPLKLLMTLFVFLCTGSSHKLQAKVISCLHLYVFFVC